VIETRPVLAGEEVPLEALNAWLLGAAPEVGRVMSITQFPGGFSNLTYLLTSECGEFVLRRPPRGVAKSSAPGRGPRFGILSGVGWEVPAAKDGRKKGFSKRKVLQGNCPFVSFA